MEEPQPLPQIVAPCGGGRRSFGDTNSPEFEFWMVRNPSCPPPNLLTADELFSGGVLLPLRQLNLSSEAPASPPREAEASVSDRRPEVESTATESAEFSVASALTSSKRWRDIFRKNDRKNGGDPIAKEKDNGAKERRREKKNNGVGGASAGAAELNINIWPFARSRSAGNGGNRPRAPPPRKVSSAPCSRSNSRGESKSRKWPSSPARAGVHLGRSSPVWQARRSIGSRSSDSSAASTATAEKAVKRDGIDGRRRAPVAAGSKAKVLSLNVPVCMGYRQHFSCGAGGGAVGAAAVGGRSAAAAGESVRGSNLFRSLFTKKVY